MSSDSRYVRGKANLMAVAMPDSSRMFSGWRNPLKGDDKKMVNAEVNIRRGGLHVGVVMKF